jgi:hypothetical protein
MSRTHDVHSSIRHGYSRYVTYVNHNDEDYSKNDKFIFEASTGRHGKIECPHEFDTGWNTLSESDIKN